MALRWHCLGHREQTLLATVANRTVSLSGSVLRPSLPQGAYFAAVTHHAAEAQQGLQLTWRNLGLKELTGLLGDHMPMAVKPQHPLPGLVLSARALLSLFVPRALVC